MAKKNSLVFPKKTTLTLGFDNSHSNFELGNESDVDNMDFIAVVAVVAVVVFAVIGIAVTGSSDKNSLIRVVDLALSFLAKNNNFSLLNLKDLQTTIAFMMHSNRQNFPHFALLMQSQHRFLSLTYFSSILPTQ